MVAMVINHNGGRILFLQEVTSDITTPDFEECEEDEASDIGLETPPPPQLPPPSTLDQLIRKLQSALAEHKGIVFFFVSMIVCFPVVLICSPVSLLFYSSLFCLC